MKTYLVFQGIEIKGVNFQFVNAETPDEAVKLFVERSYYHLANRGNEFTVIEPRGPMVRGIMGSTIHTVVTK